MTFNGATCRMSGEWPLAKTTGSGIDYDGGGFNEKRGAVSG